MLELYDSNLSLITSGKPSITRLCGTDELPAGTYYVKITDESNDEVISYDITLTVTPCSTSGSGDGWTIFGNDMYSNVSGNVGIGTTSPEALLHLKTKGGNNEIRLDGAETGVANEIFINFRDGAGTLMGRIGDSASVLQELSMIGFANTMLRFLSNGIERMRITTAGNVGIGSTNPLAKLHVETPNNCVYALSTGSGGQIAVIGEARGQQARGVFGYATGNNGYGVYGIGKGYDFYAAGPGTNYGAASSIRWKENIIEIENALDKILNIRGVYFDWDTEHGGEHGMGFIAEEVGEYIPEIVSYEEDGNDATGLDYGAITPILVQAVKELKSEKDAEIATLKTENKQLRETLTAMADRQEAIEDMLLALSTSLPKEKLVKLDHVILDEVQKTIQ
jgi:hypothetical protein